MQFRKKPVVVNAWKVADLMKAYGQSLQHLPTPIRKAFDKGDFEFRNFSVAVLTLEGVMAGRKDDWIIEGVNGELYPCKPDIFAQTYEAV